MKTPLGGPARTIDVYLYNDDGGEPDGLHVYVADLPFTKTAGASYFGRASFTYNINVGGLSVTPGRYWIGMRNSAGSGSGTNYWMSSDAGPDGAGTSHGYFSLDGGNTWMPEGSGYHHAFRIEGEFVPEPSTILAVGAGLAALAARRRRR
ncbi:MAG: choice-of-anchor R domain-containing protein [Armatimonadota bacterium]